MGTSDRLKADAVTEPAAISARQRMSPTYGALVALGVATYLLTAIACSYAFRLFQLYDDEGYLLISVKQFTSGHALYDEVYSQYGPFYYWFYWLLLRLRVLQANSDSARIFVTIAWVFCSVLAGLFVHHWSRSTLLALISQGLVFAALYGLASEPAHPQCLCVIVVTLVTVLAASWLESQPAISALGLGVLVGCLTLTKVNVGLFVVLSIALCYLPTARHRFPGRLLGRIGAAGALAFPSILMHAQLGTGWARNYAALVTLSMVPILLIMREPLPSRVRPEHWRRALCGFLAAISAVGAATLLRGTSLRGLIDGILVQPARFASVYSMPAQITVGGVVCAGGSVFAFLILHWLWNRRPSSGLLTGIGRFAKVIFFFFVAVHLLTQDYYPVLNYALPFGWLVLVPDVNLKVGPRQWWARRLLAVMTVVHSLVAFPVAGTQQALATYLVGIESAVCLADVVGGILSLARRRLQLIQWMQFSEGCACIVLIGIETFLATRAHSVYRHALPLNLSGARWVRLPEPQVVVYQWLTANLTADADAFLTLPGMNSLYLWTGIDPPSTRNTTTWMSLLGPDAQSKIIDRLRDDLQCCAVRNVRLARQWLLGQQAVNAPLVEFLDNKFRTTGRVESFELRVRTDRPTPPWTDCGTILEAPLPGPESASWIVQLHVPRYPGRAVQRVQIAEAFSGRISADSESEFADEKVLVGLTANPSSQPRILNIANSPLALDTGAELWLATAAPGRLPPAGIPVIRLLDGDGIIGSLPLVR